MTNLLLRDLVEGIWDCGTKLDGVVGGGRTGITHHLLQEGSHY